MGRRLGGETLYDCKQCAENPGLYKILGHDGPPIGTMWKENLVDGKPLERCPLRSLQLADPLLVQEINRHVNEYFPFYEDGHLLVGGGISDQPARSIAYMLEIKRLQNVVDARSLELATTEDGGLQ